MKPSNPPTHFNQAGFSLVEIMVGLAIGLLATLVVLQVFSVYEGQKRTTTGTADAQTNGNVALYDIKRDLGMAGYGLLPISNTPQDCGLANLPFTIDATTGLTGVNAIAPVTITDGGTGTGASDIITIHYGASDSGGGFSPVAALFAGNTVSVNDNLACNLNDIALIVHSTKGSCDLTKVQGLPTTRNIQLPSIPPTTAVGDNLACLGTWKEIEYRINQNYNPAVAANSQAYLQRKQTLFPPGPPPGGQPAEPSVADIVNIQAQYGISASATSNKIIQWVNARDAANWKVAVDGQLVTDASGNNIDFGPSLTVDNRRLIKAVRVAVVARNGLLEKTNVTNSYFGKACSSLTANAPSGVCAWAGSSAGTAITSPAPEIDLSNDTNWQHYRYRVFETIIPMRNVIWSGSVL